MNATTNDLVVAVYKAWSKAARDEALKTRRAHMHAGMRPQEVGTVLGSALGGGLLAPIAPVGMILGGKIGHDIGKGFNPETANEDQVKLKQWKRRRGRLQRFGSYIKEHPVAVVGAVAGGLAAGEGALRLGRVVAQKKAAEYINNLNKVFAEQANANGSVYEGARKPV